MIKTFLLIFTISFFYSFQQISPPPLVKETFSKMYPGITSKDWNYEDFVYINSFQLKGKKTKAKFTIDGKWKETETDLTFSELPIEVQTVYNTNFNSEVSRAGKIERADSEIVYSIETLQDESILRIEYSGEGKQNELSIKKNKK